MLAYRMVNSVCMSDKLEFEEVIRLKMNIVRRSKNEIFVYG